MHEALFIEVDFHSGIHQGVDVRVTGPSDYYVVSTYRNEDSHVYSAESRDLEGSHNGLVRQEVRGGDVDVSFSVADGGEVGLHYVGVRGVRPRCRYLHRQYVVDDRCLEVFDVVEKLSVRYEGPVIYEHCVKHGDGLSFHSNLGVAPYSALGAVEISVGDVHSSGVADFAIDNGDFTVVSVVRLVSEVR